MRGKDGQPHSDLTAPLRDLTKKDVPYKWTKECPIMFKELKEKLTDTTVLVPYVPGLEMRLYMDYGPNGVASTVAQNHPHNGKSALKAIHYKSRRLDKAEINYEKVEGESVAIYTDINMNKNTCLEPSSQ